MEKDLKVLLCGFGYVARYLYQNFRFNYRILSRTFLDLIPEDDFLPDMIIDSIPPVYENQRIINPIYKEFLTKIGKKKKFVYIHISSTSVYPEDTEDYNEMSQIDNFSVRGKKRWHLENQILEVFPDALILRAGGIYGPGRNLIESIRNKNFTMIPSEDKIVHRIHVYDLCNLIARASLILINKEFDSVFPGYKRKNLINAIEPEPYKISYVLDYIQKNFKIEHNIKIKPSSTFRKITSLYAQTIIKFKYPNFIKGFSEFI